MHCETCQTTVVDGAKFCPFCGGKLTPEAPGATSAADLAAQAPTVALRIGPCESCGAPSIPGSTLCLPCTRAFESILGTANTTATADMPAVQLADAATIVSLQAPVLPSAPGASDALSAAAEPLGVPADEEPLADDEEYVDDDLMADEAATVLSIAPPEPSFSASPEWTPSAEASDAIMAVAPWARKGPEADTASEPEDAAAPAGPEPLPWWERSGQTNPAAVEAKPETARYVPPPSTAPTSTSLEATVARQSMRPKTATMPAMPIPVVTRPAPAAGRSRTLVIGAAIAGVAAIGTPFAWKLAFASKPTTVSALPYEPTPASAPAPVAPPRSERTHGTPAEAPRVYQDLLTPAAEVVTVVAPAPSPAPSAAPATHVTPRPAPKKPGQPAAAPEPVATVVAPPEPAPLVVSTPPPVVTAPAEAAPAPPPPVRAEAAVPLGKLFEVSQVDERPQVTSRFEPVLPARLAGAPQPVVVIVRVLVSPAGRAAEASALRNPTTDAGLGAAAVATVRQWTFSPARKKGQPVSCWYNVGVAFKAPAGN